MERLLTMATQAGFSRAQELHMPALTVMQQVRDMCASDRCRSYGHSWSCPPACGTLEQCQQRIDRYQRGLLVQTTGDMEDDFDWEAIGAAHTRHKAAFDTLVRQIRVLHPDCLPLTAGACTLCRKCTYPDKPCRFPQRRFASMEAYGLLVSDVCIQSGVAYNYGPKTITYTSCILIDLRKGRDEYGNTQRDILGTAEA